MTELEKKIIEATRVYQRLLFNLESMDISDKDWDEYREDFNNEIKKLQKPFTSIEEFIERETSIAKCLDIQKIVVDKKAEYMKNLRKKIYGGEDETNTV